MGNFFKVFAVLSSYKKTESVNPWSVPEIVSVVSDDVVNAMKAYHYKTYVPIGSFYASSFNYKDTKKTQVTIKGLKKNTKYYFKVYPSRKDFTGDYYDGADSKIKSIKTKKYKKSKKK